MPKQPTPKQLGLTDDTELSPTFANSRKCYKIINRKHLLGYYMSGDGFRAPFTFRPIYEAWIYVWGKGDDNHVFVSYELGESLNTPWSNQNIDSNHPEHSVDFAKTELARVAGQALRSLDVLAECQATRAARAKAPPRRARTRATPRSKRT